MESYIFRVEISIKETSQLIADKAMERCFGLMGHFTKDNGKMEFKMERDKFICLEIK